MLRPRPTPKAKTSTPARWMRFSRSTADRAASAAQYTAGTDSPLFHEHKIHEHSILAHSVTASHSSSWSLTGLELEVSSYRTFERVLQSDATAPPTLETTQCLKSALPRKSIRGRYPLSGGWIWRFPRACLASSAPMALGRPRSCESWRVSWKPRPGRSISKGRTSSPPGSGEYPPGVCSRHGSLR